MFRSRHQRRSAQRLAGVGLLLLSAACGTTVPTAGGSGAAGAGLTTDSLAAPDAAGVGPAADGSVAGDSVPPGAVVNADGTITTASGEIITPGSTSGGAVSGPAAGPAAGPGGAAAPGGQPRAVGAGGAVRGVTNDAIVIGTIDSQSQDQVLADAGIKGGSQGSNERKATALINKINKDGGIAGRKLKLNVFKTTSSSTPEAICAYFTQDRPVFAVLSYGQFSGEDLRACLAKKSVVFLSDHGTHFDDKDLRASPGLWPTLGFNVQRKIPAYVDGLQAQGYFTPWDPQAAAPAKVGEAKVGLLYYDEEFNKRHNPALRAAMAKHGMTFFREFAIRTDNNGQADLKAAVLRFASDGVTHIIFNQEINAAMFGLFAVNAGSQAYYPRYGVSSYDFPSLTKQNIPDHKVFNGLKGIGWLPYTDVDKPRGFSPLQQSCLKIFEDAGQVPADINERTIMLINCDVFFKFATVAGKAGRDLSTASFFRGIPTLGASQPCYVCDKVDYSRHIDGIAAVSYLEFANECDCIRYTKTGVPAP